MQSGSLKPHEVWRRTSFVPVFVAVIVSSALLGTLGFAADPQPHPKFLLAWGKRGHKPGEFSSPINIAISKRDVIFVGDLNNARIQKFDTDGKYLGGFDIQPDKPPRKQTAIGGMALAEDEQAPGEPGGLIYLAFMNQHRLGVYTGTGKWPDPKCCTRGYESTDWVRSLCCWNGREG